MAKTSPNCLLRPLLLLVVLATAASCGNTSHYVRGAELSQKGKYPEAIAELSRAIQGNPSSALAHYQRGFAYQATGAYEMALTRLQHRGRA